MISEDLQVPHVSWDSEFSHDGITTLKHLRYKNWQDIPNIISATQSFPRFNLSNDACIDASFSPIGLIHRISDQTVAVFSASEGTGGLDIIAINGRDMVRQKQQGFLLFRSTPAPNQVRLNTSKSASLIFPCELDLAHTGKELDIACSAQSKGWAAKVSKPGFKTTTIIHSR